jgi:hypothetical protein
VVYGQALINGKLTSYASSLDTVSHEIFHGITAFSSKLETGDAGCPERVLLGYIRGNDLQLRLGQG